MSMAVLYLLLLLGGVLFFVMHYVALSRLAGRLRHHHPAQWKIIAEDERGLAVSGLARWVRLQNALRSPVLPALEDATLNRWRKLWRAFPLLAWLCLLTAFALRWAAH